MGMNTASDILKWDYVTFERRDNSFFILQMKYWIHKQ